LVVGSVDVNDENGLTRLHWAGFRNHSAAIRMLIDNGARILLDVAADVNAHGTYQRTALDLAAWRGYRDVVDVLLDHKTGLPTPRPFGRTWTRRPPGDLPATTLDDEPDCG
jgi:ankyrin repeat protein